MQHGWSCLLLALHCASASRRCSSEAASACESPSRRLLALIEDKLQLAAERMARGPPAFERFPDKALRFRDWGKETRWGRGDAYPLYTLDTMRNLADNLFDWTSGYRSGASRAAQVKPCDLVYSTLRPTTAFVQKVHQHIRVPYLLLTDTADDPITPGKWTNQMLGTEQLWRWWAVDNEISHAKLESIPIGVSDNLEPPGKPKQPESMVFHANTSRYLLTLRRAVQQPKQAWLMMQMSDTHPERRRVRQTFLKWRGEAEDIEVQLTPESPQKLTAPQFLEAMGRHRFVLSPRGNGVDAHRTWEARPACAPHAHHMRTACAPHAHRMRTAYAPPGRASGGARDPLRLSA